MRNFLIGLVIGVLLCGLTLLVLVFAMVRFAGSFANRPVNVADGSTLVLDLEGDVPERLPAEIPISIPLSFSEPDAPVGGTSLGHFSQSRRRFAHSWNPV